jgi:tetratricopeptide (TPR) repeat protein
LLEPPGGAPGEATSGSLERIDRSIGTWNANLAANAKDFLAATNLGILYHARGRLTGDVADYARGKEALDRALAIAPTHAPARATHAVVLAALHDFEGALTEAEDLYADDPSQAQALATIGDASLELGRYDRARAALDELAIIAPGAPVTARLARLAYLEGRTADAVDMAERAVAESHAAGDQGPALGWYLYLAGTVARWTGDLATAGERYAAAAAVWPGSHLVLAGQARLAVAAGRVDEAIELFERSTAIVPAPENVAALGDLYRLTGRAAEAEVQFATVRAIGTLAAASGPVFDRTITLFELDHGGNPAAALARAEEQLRSRGDVFGHDLHAWALFANGRLAEAETAAGRARALGTRDALLDYHAGLIAAAQGDDRRARELLGDALRLGLGTDPIAAERAQSTLALLGKTP